MPAHAGKARVKMPEQVDRTRAPVKSAALPPSVLAAMEKEKEKEEETQVGEPAQKSTPEFAPPPAAPQPSAPSWTDSPAYAKLYKVHCIKLRSLAKSLDGCAPRDQSRAVEWTAGPADRVRAWASDNFKPEAVAPAVGERAPARIWVPEVRFSLGLTDSRPCPPASSLTHSSPPPSCLPPR
jgi:hypothetical protein